MHNRRQFVMALGSEWIPTQLLVLPQNNLQGHLKHSRTFVARSKSTISSELITDQLSGEFNPYNGWH